MQVRFLPGLLRISAKCKMQNFAFYILNFSFFFFHSISILSISLINLSVSFKATMNFREGQFIFLQHPPNLHTHVKRVKHIVYQVASRSLYASLFEATKRQSVSLGAEVHEAVFIVEEQIPAIAKVIRRTAPCDAIIPTGVERTIAVR
jgi:hypothetical protein